MKPIRGGLLLALVVLVGVAMFPAISRATYPGGKGLIAYSESTPYADNPGDRASDIFSASPSGGAPLQLTNNSVADVTPAWSADGRRIAFSRWDARKRDREVWTMDASGQHRRRVTHTRANETDPFFSPSGGRIIIARSIRRGASSGGNIVSIRTDGGAAVHLVNSGHRSSEPTFSPDGRWVAFSGAASKTGNKAGVWVMHRDGSHARLVARNHQEGSRSIFYSTPDFSPDDSRIAFQRFISDDSSSAASRLDVIVSRPRPGASRRKIAGLEQPAFSPDGTRLAGVRTLYGPLPFADPEASKIVTVARGGGQAQDVTPEAEGTFDSQPSWQPTPPG
ncbi:MAG: TolB family protein [Solirubrobacterales bacterium]